MSKSRNAWSDLDDPASLAPQDSGETSVAQKKRNPSSGGPRDEQEVSQEAFSSPEDYFSPDPFEPGPSQSDEDTKLVESPFGSIRRGER